MKLQLATLLCAATAATARDLLPGATLKQVNIAEVDAAAAESTWAPAPKEFGVSGLGFRVNDFKPAKADGVGAYPLCNLCVQLGEQGLNYLLNVILNAGVVGGCADLCSYLPQKLEQEACNVVCDAAGIYGFIQAIEKADLDPIYYCELLDNLGETICPIQDCPAENPDCVVLDSLTADPTSGPVGTEFTFTLLFSVANATGTGEIRFNLCDPSKQCQEQSQVVLGFDVGNYRAPISFDTKGQQLPTGDYSFDIQLCEGQCGAHHPHSKDFGTLSVPFTITKSGEILDTKGAIPSWLKLGSQ